MSLEVSVIIPSRNELQNLIWTLQATQLELEGIDYEIIVVLDSCDDADAQEERLLKYWPTTTSVLKVLRREENPSCWQARNYGAREAIGEYLLFLDSHVMPKQGSFQGALEYHRCFRGILALAVNYWLDHPARTLYAYKWQSHKFWGAWSRRKPELPNYRILMSGMNLMLDRKVFEQVHGFPSSLGIYGGGEPFIYFVVQMFGYEARCVPEFQLYHLAEKRGYAWNSDDLHRNFMIAAYAIGGDDALAPLYANYERVCKGVERYLYRLDQLRDEAVALAADDRAWIEQNAKKTLAEVLDERKEG